MVTLELSLPHEATSLGSPCWVSGGEAEKEEVEEEVVVSGDRDPVELQLLLESKLDAKVARATERRTASWPAHSCRRSCKLSSRSCVRSSASSMSSSAGHSCWPSGHTPSSVLDSSAWGEEIRTCG